jgi:hypothetical protein
MIRSQSENGSGALLDDRPTRWSQRWFDDPAPGKVVLLGDRLVKVHLGGGHWQTVPRGSVEA